MGKRFAIATDPLTPDEERAFRAKLGQMGFWHWLPNFWLVKTSNDAMTATQLRDWIHEVAPQARAFVTEVQSRDWGGLFKPDEKKRDMGAWIRSDWETP